MKRNNAVSHIFVILFIFIAFLIILSTNWVLKTFSGITMEEIVFHLNVPLDGTDSDVIISFIFDSLLWSGILTTIIAYLFVKKTKYISSLKIRKKEFQFRLSQCFKIILSFLFVFLSLCYFDKRLNFIDYVKEQTINSPFIQENYVNASSVIKNSPTKKRNLVYIYLESMEKTYMSKKDGGNEEVDLIPELTQLAKDNISFSNSEKIAGGAVQLPYTSWTTSALVSTGTGLPLKLPGRLINEYKSESFLPGVTSLGDILKQQGYHNIVMCGSDITFGAGDRFFKYHGDYEMWDYNSAVSEGRMTTEQKVWWGFDDSDLFGYAKEKLADLSNADQPFNLSLMTMDTHGPNGYICDKCENKFLDQYRNVIACSSKQTADFVKWIQVQDFYKDTTIIITGDHFTMSADYSNSVEQGYQRSTYNAIINSAVKQVKEKNRQFSTMDLYPTVMSALGFEVSDGRMGLGTDLFSREETLIEKHGLSFVYDELTSHSHYYNTEFLGYK